MIIKRISIFVIMCLFVSGCGKKNTISETVSSCYMYNWCYTEDGIVYQNPNGGKNRKTEYFDYETKKYYPLCGKPVSYTHLDVYKRQQRGPWYR